MKPTPGQRDGITTNPRIVLLSTEGVTRLPGGVTIDATYAIDGGNTGKTDELRAGWLLAQITSSGLWVPLKRTTVAADFSGSGSGNTGNDLPVANAAAFKADDQITVTVAAGTVNVTVSSVNYTQNTLTLDTAVDNPPVGGAVYARGDIAGAETARCILGEHVKLLDLDDQVWRDKQAGDVYLAALVDKSQILGDVDAARTSGNSELSGILWGDRQGLT